MKKILLPVILASVCLFGAFSVTAQDTDNFCTRAECIAECSRSWHIPSYNEIDTSLLEAYGEELDYLIQTEHYPGEYTKSAAFALQNGLLLGDDDGKLHPERPVSRAEFACFLYRSKDLFKYSHLPIMETDGAVYTDVEPWYEDAARYCMEYGLMIGCGDRFDGDTPITRGQVSLVIERAVYGISVKDKYLALYIAHQTEDDIPAMLAAAEEDYRENLLDEETAGKLESGTYTRPSMKEIAEETEAAACVDYRELADERSYAYKRYSYLLYKREHSVKMPFVTDDHFPFGGLFGSRSGTLLHEYAAEHHIIREGFYVINPDNSYFFPLAVGGHFLGYEYFRYSSCDADALPAGVSVGKWYRSRIRIRYLPFNSSVEYSITHESTEEWK